MPDSQKHHLPKRRSTRLSDYDYTWAGAYFVTTVTHGRECLFGQVANGEMQVNAYGSIATECWEAIPKHFPLSRLDQFVVMPNHIHGILLLDGPGTTLLDKRERYPMQAFGRPSGSPLRPQGPAAASLGAIVGAFKAAASKHINAGRNTSGAPVWQRNYHEHIIRSETDLRRLREYIHLNPVQWELDRENPYTLSKPHGNRP
ncbi:MAG: transposase [Dehalococcoidia bacterium]